jgi:hypothetical protein
MVNFRSKEIQKVVWAGEIESGSFNGVVKTIQKRYDILKGSLLVQPHKN